MRMVLDVDKIDRNEVERCLTMLLHATGGELLYRSCPTADGNQMEVTFTTRTIKNHVAAGGELCYGCQEIIPDGEESYVEIWLADTEHVVPFCRECDGKDEEGAE